MKDVSLLRKSQDRALGEIDKLCRSTAAITHPQLGDFAANRVGAGEAGARVSYPGLSLARDA